VPKIYDHRDELMENHNPYLSQVWNALPRLLSLFDTDPLSVTFGIGDRYRWAWKLIDFGNGTFQGAAHGLARLLVNGMLPEGLSDAAVLRRIEAMFQGAEALRYPNGSLSEAFPFESSFCVTALVAYDLLTAMFLLESKFSALQRKRYLSIVRPLIRFLHKSDETHAFISNHLATASVALYKWSEITGEAGEKRGRELLDRILKNQSEEGWFKEYEGADPGYQSLCLYYLADLHLMRPDLNILEPIRRSIRFLWHFAHPDGSFGGHYGSRNTRFYFPAGLEALAPEISEAAILATFMRRSINRNNTVTLSAMDDPNLTPMFNAYCWAAALFDNNPKGIPSSSIEIPSVSKKVFRKHYPEAGLLIDKGREHYTVISLHKGGVCYHFHLDNDGNKIDCGSVAKAANGKLYSTQAYNKANETRFEGDTVEITATYMEVHVAVPTTIQFIILRLLNITFMRIGSICDLVKKTLVRFLITGKKMSSLKNKRTIKLGHDIAISDQWINNSVGFSHLYTDQPFSAIHMASQGYWQKQDDAK
jgi:hypothetical protein